jgi:hypothetical protein
VAVQIDLAIGPVNGVVGVNIANSRTVGGQNDDTASYAVQYIIAPSEPVVFTPACTASINGILADITNIAKTESTTTRDADINAQTDNLNNTLLNTSCYTPGTPTGGQVLVTVNQRKVSD